MIRIMQTGCMVLVGGVGGGAGGLASSACKEPDVRPDVHVPGPLHITGSVSYTFQALALCRLIHHIKTCFHLLNCHTNTSHFFIVDDFEEIPDLRFSK